MLPRRLLWRVQIQDALVIQGKAITEIVIAPQLPLTDWASLDRLLALLGLLFLLCRSTGSQGRGNS